MARLLQILASTTALLSCAAAEDVLYSEQALQKRYIDAQGNYNICMPETSIAAESILRWY